MSADKYQQFLDSLTAEEREAVEGAVSRALEEWPYGTNSKALGGGLWEVRVRLPTRIARAFLGKTPERVIPLDGLIKKDVGRHTQVIKRARKQLRQHINQSQGRRGY